MNKSYRESHKDKGADYHETFASYPHRAMVWRQEQECIMKILRKYFDSGQPENYLDFACGTGRILGFLKQRVVNATGIDISSSMLEEAKSNANNATLIEGDLTRDDILNDDKFDLITAFRFFPNAEPELRIEAMKSIARRMSESGILIFNNHMNTSSIKKYILKKLNKGNTEGMSIDDVYSLSDSAGLVIDEVYPIAILPLTDKHMILPGSISLFFERLLSRMPLAEKMAQNNIYVARKNNQIV